MAAKWFFHASGQTIVLRSRIKVGDTIGDTEQRIEPDTEIGVPGLTHDALLAASPGVLEFADDGSFKITPSTDQREG